MADPQHSIPPVPRGFAGARRRAADLAGNASKVADLLVRATSKAGTMSGRLAGVRNDLSILFRFLKAWLGRKYTDVSAGTVVTVIAAVLYFVNPFDVIPDLLPFLGYVDDVSVIAFVLAALRSEIERFRTWESQQGDQPSSAA